MRGGSAPVAATLRGNGLPTSWRRRDPVIPGASCGTKAADLANDPAASARLAATAWWRARDPVDCGGTVGCR